MKRTRRPHDETIALARRLGEQPGSDPVAETYIARDFARCLFRALKARTGAELEALLTRDGMMIVDPAFDAADRLYRRARICVEPCRRLLPDQPVAYLARWPNGDSRNLTEAELLTLAGMSV